jgi:hypothetical protein
MFECFVNLIPKIAIWVAIQEGPTLGAAMLTQELRSGLQQQVQVDVRGTFAWSCSTSNKS